MRSKQSTTRTNGHLPTPLLAFTTPILRALLFRPTFGLFCQRSTVYFSGNNRHSVWRVMVQAIDNKGKTHLDELRKPR
jgi:hypothetical protein